MSNGYLTTHVLDIYNGTPGKGIRGEIFRIENEKKHKIKEFKLNNDGRSDSPILETLLDMAKKTLMWFGRIMQD